jgi:hypothetical protein
MVWHLVSVFLLSVCSSTALRAGDFLAVSGPYLGQKPPGNTPEIFAPSLISKSNSLAGGVAFSGDGLLLAYKLEVPSGDTWDEQIWFSHEQGGRWTEPSRFPFDGQFHDWDSQFSRAERSLYFTSKRPARFQGNESKYSHIWKSEFINDGWTEPTLVAEPVNQLDNYSGYPSFTNDGTVYFHSQRPDGRGGTDIYRARSINGKYADVENLGEVINTPGQDLDPAIAPDESFLIFLSNRPNNGPTDYDLFIAFRDSDDNWSEPQGLYPLVGNNAGLPGISADGKYFFFTRYDKIGGTNDGELIGMDAYWVSTKALRQLND